MWYLAGGGKSDLYYEDSPNAIDGVFASVTELAVSPNGGVVYLTDNNANAIRTVVTSGWTQCPAGFACSCGRDIVPCTNTSAFCAANAAQPVPVPANCQAVTESSPFVEDAGAMVSTSFAQCPLGSYCVGGAAMRCTSGTYGTRVGQRVAADCTPCAAGTYIAEAGGAASSSSTPCLACPVGSYALGANASACAVCFPGTHAGSPGSAAACTPCAAGTVSLFGAGACFTLQPTDGFEVAGASATLQCALAVSSGNLLPAAATRATILIAAPIALTLLLPYVIYLLLATPASISREASSLIIESMAD
jgi:hypothetical protein